MTGKRTIKVHGEKIAKARAERKLDQAAFAGIAGMSVRTLQRAEKNGMISPRKIRQIADALKISPEELTRDEPSATSKDNRNDGFGTLILKPMRSHKDFQQLILLHRPKFLNLDYQINPQPEYVEKVAGVIEEIQWWIKIVDSGLYEEEWDDPPDYVKRFKRDMEFTRNLVDLWAGGISVFAGHYTYRHLKWEDSIGEIKTWAPYSKSIAALRFFDDKKFAQSDEISERVFYGLSKSTLNTCQWEDIKDIRIDGTTHDIYADNQIKASALETPF